MDNSQWFNQVAARMNNHNNVGDRVDLTLKLGLPNSDQNPVPYQLRPHVSPASMAPGHLANLSFAGPNTQGMNQMGMFNQGAMVQGQQSFNGSQYAWPTDQIVSNVHNMNYANAFNQCCSPSLGFPSYNSTNSYNNFGPTHPPPPPHHHQLPAPSLVPSNIYTLIDVPPRRAANQHQLELGSSSGSSSGKQRQRRQRGGNYNDPNKRCTNYNCNTNDTPMWRKGPLGPKTLCNACGIKYRKEEEKRRAKEAGSSGQQSNPNG
ncbi:GATA transcription factor 29-like [Durio zibethinus]|uniref:GATA transcription factor 29-like n=1 Tax=Durio zibethinus TaxID=66656 RepID=A0A6P5XKP6_DURZI|nr:GATA transcription factor 29-like [Durio zibethinus]